MRRPLSSTPNSIRRLFRRDPRLLLFPRTSFCQNRCLNGVKPVKSRLF